MSHSVFKVDGQKIRLIRDRAGINLTDFAQMIGTHRAHLSRIERDKGQPSVRLRQRIITALDVTLDDIVKPVETSAKTA